MSKRFYPESVWRRAMRVQEVFLKAIAGEIKFQVEAPVTRRSPHRPVLEDFPHTVPRFRFFLPNLQPIRRHPDWCITLLPA